MCGFVFVAGFVIHMPSLCVISNLTIILLRERESYRGGSRVSENGVHMYKGVGVRFADFIFFMLKWPMEMNNLVSLRPNYFICVGYLKTGTGVGVQANPLIPLWICH